MRIIPILLISALAFSCVSNKEKLSQKEEALKAEYLLKGKEIVALTHAELSKNVSTAMKKGGPDYAVDFCNLRAMELKDSLSALNQCKIQRISLKYRNPNDKPDSKIAEDQLLNFQQIHERGDTLMPSVYLFDDRIEYYQPIIIKKGTCLICHGDPDTQIPETTLEIINERYPGDLARDFSLNDFRGSWKISFTLE